MHEINVLLYLLGVAFLAVLLLMPVFHALMHIASVLNIAA